MKRIKTSFSDNPPSYVPSARAANPIELDDSVNDPYGDTNRTVTRYRESLEQLKEVLKHARDWKAFQFSELDDIPDDNDSSKLRQAINDLFQRTEAKVKSPTRWEKCKSVIEVIYTALSPFVKNLLVMVSDSSGVRIGVVHSIDIP